MRAFYKQTLWIFQYFLSLESRVSPQAAKFSLSPTGTGETVIVSATLVPIRLSESPGGALYSSATDLASNPSLMVDDALRQAPGFSLFHRSSSRTANPTTLGVSLRGLGANGASRALVLDDGVPLLDPFGSWVYWDRVPRAAIESVELFRGASSNLYGIRSRKQRRHGLRTLALKRM